MLCVVWAVLDGFGIEFAAGVIAAMLLVSGVGMSLFLGIAAGLATHTEVTHLETELERERREVAVDPLHERAEVMALYAA